MSKIKTDKGPIIINESEIKILNETSSELIDIYKSLKGALSVMDVDRNAAKLRIRSAINTLENYII